MLRVFQAVGTGIEAGASASVLQDIRCDENRVYVPRGFPKPSVAGCGHKPHPCVSSEKIAAFDPYIPCQLQRLHDFFLPSNKPHVITELKIRYCTYSFRYTIFSTNAQDVLRIRVFTYTMIQSPKHISGNFYKISNPIFLWIMKLRRRNLRLFRILGRWRRNRLFRRR